MAPVPFWKAPCTPPRQIFSVPFGKHSRPDAEAADESMRKRQRVAPPSPASVPTVPRTGIAAKESPRPAPATHGQGTPTWIHQILREASAPTCAPEALPVDPVQARHVRRLGSQATTLQRYIAVKFRLSPMTLARGQILMRTVLAKSQHAIVKNSGEDNVNTRLYALCAVTCMVLSCKCEEQFQLPLQELLAMRDVLPYPLLQGDIQNMELRILFHPGMRWDVHVRTRLDVVHAVLTGLALHMQRIGARLPVAFAVQAHKLAFWSRYEERLLRFSEGEVGVASLWCVEDEVSGPHVWNYLTVACHELLNEKVTTIVKVFALEHDLGGAG